MAILIGMAVALTSTSCIYDAPDDIFYRTLWESDEESFGIEELTLEFLCGNNATLKNDLDCIISYGTYDSNDETAVFYDLTLEIKGKTITFIDAHRSGASLQLRWYNESSPDTQTTSMHRLSAYK